MPGDANGNPRLQIRAYPGIRKGWEGGGLRKFIGSRRSAPNMNIF